MKKVNNYTLFYSTFIIIIIILSIGYVYYSLFYVDEQKISDLTDNWFNQVTIHHDPEAIANLFCRDGSLVGTVSRTKRKGKDIKLYFDYFANLPNIRIIEKKYNISKVSANVYINTAFITWYWDELKEPIVARMTFVFNGNCIFQLHSSALPDLNTNLVKISGNI